MRPRARGKAHWLDGRSDRRQLPRFGLLGALYARRLADAGVPVERIVNTWTADDLVEWTTT